MVQEISEISNNTNNRNLSYEPPKDQRWFYQKVSASLKVRWGPWDGWL